MKLLLRNLIGNRMNCLEPYEELEENFAGSISIEENQDKHFLHFLTDILYTQH